MALLFLISFLPTIIHFEKFNVSICFIWLLLYPFDKGLGISVCATELAGPEILTDKVVEHVPIYTNAHQFMYIQIVPNPKILIGFRKLF